MAEDSNDLGHYILLNNTSILAKKSTCKDQLVREEIQIEPHPTV
jgi:hypothetical protein